MVGFLACLNRNYMKNQVSSHSSIIYCYEFLDIDPLGITRFSAYFQRNTRFRETLLIANFGRNLVIET